MSRLADIPDGEVISFYRNGEFINMCAGTHAQSTGDIKAFKLLKIAGAYHRGDEKNKQLQRIYGTAFFSQKELDAWLNQQEEAKKRDHRKIGKEMALFHIEDKVGPGLILWQPHGAVIRQELQNFIGEELRKQGYQQVFTPHIGRLELYRTSGHYPYYKDSQFPPVIERETLTKWADEGCSCAELCSKMEGPEAEGFLLKPMNCPMHAQIYRAEPRSYRDLPLRLAEFGTVYRWEQSGELNGMTRVRGFTQDDAHLFCTEDQVPQEVMGCLELVKVIFKTLGMKDYRVRIGLRDPDSSKYVGHTQTWDKAESALREAAKTLGVPFTEEPGEAAFYGPKIDFVVQDVIGREWQLGTIQIDYVQPERFDLTYIGSDNKPHRPVMVHRAPFGSMERFCGVLIEHFGGNFPTWLAPEQVRILTLNDQVNDYAESVKKRLQDAKIRVVLDNAPDKLGAKIRKAELARVPYMLIVGAKEAEQGQVSVRSRVRKDLDGAIAVDKLQELLVEEIQNRTLPSNTGA
ncbi:MAG: threonine--tRNA ligase [Verrucomicrobia bacterium 21-51-4]|nr:MAG: threonine--tRNA ligase [Verrucomicrobia bacterium 21-51-4]